MAAPDLAATVGLSGSPVRAGDVVDDARTGGDRGGHDRGMAGVDRDAEPALGQAPHHRHHAADFLFRRDFLRTGPGGFAADVDDVSALPGEAQALRGGILGGGEVAAVGEAVRRDIDHAHDQRVGEVEAGPVGAGGH